MTHPSSTDLAAASTALHAQWDVLRRWVGTVVDPRAARAESVLDGWTVGDLVAHLGRAMDSLTAVEVAPAGTVPLTLAEYLGQYADRASETAETTRQLAAELGDDPLPAVDALARAAFARLDALGTSDAVVLARRGPVLLSDMVASRVLELVVHADDLARSLRGSGRVDPSGAGPVDRDALDLVAGVLLRIVVARGGWSLEVARPLTWVRLAAGRVPYDVDVLAEALSPQYTSEAVPDLGRMLPLL
ncbi:maleylpyruvate isomerase N-terminal domain-containing protein [Cellulomonas sp. NS3]|uniref:maleylpyruvate isomerase N-terminal domain-containing protein n=1 Tax=Cellulomonas sp. NS3 TaxID=2973977 RepID=UPI0021619024|nr:maleylpyruvate isomerase N-terminal domain-containing protein [Cellulomonas sp. NS3]